jgi:hypothetical protein
MTNLAPDTAVVTDFCQTGTGRWRIDKTHWQAFEWDGIGKIIFIQRDPRDVAVSAMYYRASMPNNDESLTTVIKIMFRLMPEFEGKIYHEQGSYAQFIRNWVDLAVNCADVMTTKYEWLHQYGDYELWRFFEFLTNNQLDKQDALAVLDRQAFDRHAANYLHSMRKGIAGDWRNHFKRSHGQLITDGLGDLMIEQGYIVSLDWWKELPNG